MKKRSLLTIACAGFTLLASCGEPDEAFIEKKGATKEILAATAGVDKALKEQKIGKGLAKEGVLSKLAGKRFAGYQLEKAPEYYIVYFSASW